MMDPLYAVLDEVALEGLDGISIQTLWMRLRMRQPEFGLNLDPLTQNFIWTYLSRTPEVRFYLMPEPRKHVTVYDRFVEVDPNTGIHKTRQVDPEDPYPVNVVTDDPSGIQGSCLFYKERTDVTEQIRTTELKALMTLDQTQTQFGEKLVIVASQEVRYRALIGPEGNSELKLADQTYCILERLGRARWQGELQRELHTKVFRMDAGKMHYLRRKLDRNRMITIQSHVTRLLSGGQQHSLLLLLPRFHVDRRTKYDILMESTSNVLSEAPNKMMVMQKLRHQLGVCERTFKRVYQYMLAAKMVTMLRIPLRELDPDGGPFKTLRGTDIFVRCLKLIKPYGQKDVEEDEDDENNDEDGNGPNKRNVLVVPRIIERDMLSQAYDIVESTGTRGISQSMLRGQLNVGRLEGRMVCRLLERNDMIKGFMEDEGRQRTTKYISKHFVEESKLNLQFTKEMQRSQDLREAHLNEPGAETPTAGVSQLQGRKKTQQKAKQLKQSKLHFGKSDTSLKETSLASPQECKTEASENAEAGQDGDDACPVPNEHAPIPTVSQSHCVEGTEPVVEEVLTTKKMEVQETYRLLKRKNMIIEAVKCSKIIEGFYSLQKLLTEEEKKDGVNTKVCKKSVMRLICSLSRQGLVKLYRTIIIQDGVHKKVEFVVHPSITPNDPLVKSTIEQIRMRMSSSVSTARVEPQADKVKSNTKTVKENKTSRTSQSNAPKKVNEMMGVKPLNSFKPVTIPGYGRSLGFQSKMPRLRIVHSFLWYLIYGHPLRRSSQTDSVPESQTNPEASRRDDQTEEDSDVTHEQHFEVYVNENCWKRFIPPIPLHKDFGYGWALISDVLVSLPLSVFMQICQINYKVDGLEQYLNDPIRQHYLIRFLPADIKRQLLHRRKYIFSFHESLQRLCFMGLMQFGPTERFMEKDQVFVYLKTKATIVDTTVCDPHYNRAIETIRPFERRRYVFNTAESVEKYWFDLLCVCLNTPLGVTRSRSNEGKSEILMGLEQCPRFLQSLQGSTTVVDDGVTPGDGQGAGGLDSIFFSHLKRNWSWTSHVVNTQRQNTDAKGTHQTVRLRNLLSKHPPPKPASQTAVQTDDGTLPPPAVVEEEVHVSQRPASRNEEVRGGRKLKRKRQKKETGKPVRKRPKKEVRVRKRVRVRDETDRRALLQMTKQRVTWTHLEDSLLMLCRVTSHFLNRKLKKPFVPWSVVRDVLHAEFELSQDKTSLSVSRRIRYIMKNPQTALNYRICLAELYQDKEFLPKFMNRNDDYSNPEVCAAEYKEFVSALRSKFSSSCGSSDVIIPDTKEELFKKFKVYTIGDDTVKHFRDVLNKPEDIHVLVLFNLIQSTLVLTNAQMKNYLPFQTFCLYTQYKEHVLTRAFQTCRRRGLVNRRRPMTIYGIKKFHALPFLPMSYQLSQHYYKFFTWRFPSTIFNDAYDLLTALCEGSRSDRSSSFSFQKDPESERDASGDKDREQIEEERAQERVEEQAQERVEEQAQERVGEQAQERVEEQAQERVEEQAEERVEEDEQERVEEDEQARERAEEDEQAREWAEERVEEQVQERAEAPPADSQDMLPLSMDAPGGVSACCLTLMTLGLLTVDVTIPQQIVIINSNMVDREMVKSFTKALEEEEEDDEVERKRKLEIKSHQASHTNYLLMRGYCSPGITRSQTHNSNTTDNIIINTCTVHVKLRETPRHTFFTQEADSLSAFSLSAPPSFPASFTRVYRSTTLDLQMFLERCVSVLEYGPEDVQAVQEIRDAVQKGAEIGIDRQDLCLSFIHLEQPENGRKRSLQQYIQDLVDGEQLVEVGALSHRLVCLNVASHWLLESKCDDAQMERVSLKRGPAHDPDDATPPAKKRRATESDLQDSVSTDAAVVMETEAEQQVVMEEALPKDVSDAEQHTADGNEAELDPSHSYIKVVVTDGDEGAAADQEKDSVAYESVRFVSRPWRAVDGLLNRPVCKGMLESVLLHIMSNPGIRESLVLQHYSQVLQPVIILELLQVLIDLGCLRKRYTVQQQKPSLFSKPRTPEVKGQTEVRLKDISMAFYEPTVDCTLRLARVFPHEPNWNKWVQLCLRI
ncbi:general transcription factor 3C polypeptide 1 isoform X4 [Misgurnus anguillicaudatus]|uniref:general transcription factor 3C polypeptide 1 isoform X4 n=1 Tax=Misgurnus anguillicaudatus TaxID=75329 RepID=UPI003CCF5981